ncbi:MAG: VanZ family protein [Planctomycetota bacterium]
MKHRYWLLTGAYAGLIFLVSSFQLPPLPVSPDISPDKIAHFFEYAVLAYLVYRACVDSGGFLRNKAPVISVLSAAIYAFSDEWHQLFVPGRQMSEWDFLFDSLGGITAVLVMTRLRPVKASPVETTATGPGSVSLAPFVAAVYGIGFLGAAFAILMTQNSTGISFVKSFWAGSNSLVYFGLGAVVAAVIIAVTQLLSNVSLFKRLEEEFRRILGRLKFYEVVIIALASGVGEETIFRGAVQPHLGLALTSVLFGLMHFPVSRPMIPWTIFAIVMGFILGGLYDYTGHNLIAPITAHFLINLVNLWLISKSAGEPETVLLGADTAAEELPLPQDRINPT